MWHRNLSNSYFENPVSEPWTVSLVLESLVPVKNWIELGPVNWVCKVIQPCRNIGENKKQDPGWNNEKCPMAKFKCDT